MVARSFVWLSIGGGAWSLGADWDDVTDGADPSAIAPGPSDSVNVTGPTGAGVQTITGPGAAATAAFAGNTLLSGAFSLGTLTLGPSGAGGLLQLGAGTTLQSATTTLASGSLLAGAGSQMAITGALQLGVKATGGATLDATGGARVTASSLLLTARSDSIYVDPTSIVDIGAAGTGAAGALTIEGGATLTGQGDANRFGAVVDDGTIAATTGTLTVGTVSGTGTLSIAGGAMLALNGVCAAGQAVQFAGANATLALDAEYDAPAGTLTGFAAGDAIDIVGSTISSTSYTPTGAGGGVLTLSYGGQVAARLTLAGSYTGSLFLTAGDGDGGTLITLAPSGGGGGPPSGGTATPDQYAWIAAGSGAWNSAANWQDVTSGADPASVAPGVNDLVTIAGGADSFSVIAGPANAASLTVTGEVALTGAYSLGTLAVGTTTAGGFTDGTLDLQGGTTVGAASATIADGALSVSGSTSSLSVSGALTLGGGAAGVGLPTTALQATAGGGIEAASLTIGGGGGDSITTDPTGWVEIGTAGGAAAGAVTIDPGVTLAGNGSINPLGKLVDSGSIVASGGTLTLGSITGSGALGVASGAVLDLLGATGQPIDLQGNQAGLSFAGASAAPAGPIAGFVPGDLIDLQGSPLTTIQYSAATGVLLLIYGTTIVARLNFTGIAANDRFVLTPDGAGGADIALTAATGGGGGPGQSGTDALAWTAPVSGNWSLAANWTDLTLGQPATLPPGAQTPTLVAGPAGATFQSISGTGTSASLTFSGNTVLTGSFATGPLLVGLPGTDPVAALIDLVSGSTFTATSLLLTAGDLLASGSGTGFDCTGTATVGAPDTAALLGAQAHSAIQLGSLVMNGGTVTADASASLEVGTLGGAGSGLVTVDAGAAVSGSGALNMGGAILDNGLIDAEAGTLAVGQVSGTGSLSIGTEAALAPSGAEACPIAFTGGGASLILPGTAGGLAAVISLFAPGDSIVISGSPVQTVAYQPGPGGVGTLALSYGGSLAETLLLAGNYAGDSFAVSPDGVGAQITVSSPNGATPPQGTETPDQYVWTGADSTIRADPGNWTDVTQGQTPAAVAPGQNDLVSIAGPASGALQVQGPADAAALALSGTVTLAGTYSVGSLAVGGVAAATLALGDNASLQAASAEVAGGIATDGGALTVAGSLTLGSDAGLAGVLTAGGRSQVHLIGPVLLAQPGSALAASTEAAIEIGGDAGAAAGSVTIDAGGVLQGAGLVNPAGPTVDDGTLTASGGTLVLGDVSGIGTLQIAPGAGLLLDGTLSGSLTAGFAGDGSLVFATAPSDGFAIAAFGPGDRIVLPEAGLTTASYALTAPGEGVLSLFDGDTLVAELTLLGSQAGLAYDVTAQTGGGSILTAQADNMPAPGGTTVTSAITTEPLDRGDLLAEFQADFPYVPQADIGNLVGSYTTYQYVSQDGTAPPGLYGGSDQPRGTDIEIIAPLSAEGEGAGQVIALQPGYSALVAEGTENLGITDAPDSVPIGNALIVGNDGSDQIAALGNNDTLVGAPGANTLFYAKLNQPMPSSNGFNVFILGGGDDAITTQNENAAITTSGGASTVYLGAADSDVVSDGSDLIVGPDSGNGSNTITSAAAAGRPGDVVYTGSTELVFNGGDAPSTIVGTGGQIVMTGGAGNSLLWCGSSPTAYVGGSGSAIIVGATSPQVQVQSANSPVVVFGGTGEGEYSGAAGSVFVLGAGPSTVTAAAGDIVFITGGAPVQVNGSGSGVDAYAGPSTADDLFLAGTGNETLWGGLGNDTFVAGSGTDIFTTDGGSDVFSYTSGLNAGTDYVVGFVPGQDTIALHGYGSATPNVTTAFGDSFVNLSDGTQIVLEGVASLPASVFTFA